MRKGSGTYNILFFVLAVLILFILAASFEKNVPGLAFSGASPLNIRWDGTSEFARFLAGRGTVFLVENWSSAEHNSFSGCTTLFIISPEKAFSQEELSSISHIVLESRAKAVILDEGSYGNQVLEVLGIPVRINAFKYITSLNNSGIVYGYVNVSDRVFYIAFAYVSPVTILDSGSCHPIAYANNFVVGAYCHWNDIEAVVFGDGSIAINAVFNSSSQNIYRAMFSTLIDYLCKNTSQRTFIVDASKYNPRLLSFKELVDLYGVEKAIAIYVNPVRYLYLAVYGISNQLAMQTFLIPTIILCLYSMARFKRGKIGEGLSTMPKTRMSKTYIEILRSVCLDHKDCVERLRCLTKQRMNRKCVDGLTNYFKEDLEARKKLVRHLMTLLHTEKFK
ncbi:MAG: DUF4350 domain-containing protein [Ignisphaera sp.]